MRIASAASEYKDIIMVPHGNVAPIGKRAFVYPTTFPGAVQPRYFMERQYFRPPGGSIQPAVLRRLRGIHIKQRAFPAFLWLADCLDSRNIQVGVTIRIICFWVSLTAAFEFSPPL